MQTILEQKNILLIEDDPIISIALKKDLENKGLKVWIANNTKTASKLIDDENNNFSIAFVDLDLDSPKEGFKILPKLKEKGIVSVIVTGNDSDKDIEKGYDLGCSDYITKPFEVAHIIRAIKNLDRPFTQMKFDSLLKEKFITYHPSLLDELERLKNGGLYGEVPIFIHGPTGVGKTRLAEIIHDATYGETQKFISLNCSNFNENLLESELFGHVKGAFSGADDNKQGLLELADGGTLFLDEIGAMSLRVQQKLLKVLEEKSFYPVGSKDKVTVNFRIISATCDNIFDLISKKAFRNDFFFRISGANINIPPLSERKLDIEFLIEHFKSKLGRAFVIKDDALKALLDYEWPGNIRELENFFNEKREMEKPIITLKQLPIAIQTGVDPYKKLKESILTKNQIKLIKENGLPEFIEMIQEEAFVRFKKKSKRGTMRTLNIGTHLYYKLESNLASEYPREA